MREHPGYRTDCAMPSFLFHVPVFCADNGMICRNDCTEALRREKLSNLAYNVNNRTRLSYTAAEGARVARAKKTKTERGESRKESQDGLTSKF